MQPDCILQTAIAMGQFLIIFLQTHQRNNIFLEHVIRLGCWKPLNQFRKTVCCSNECERTQTKLSLSPWQIEPFLPFPAPRSNLMACSRSPHLSHLVTPLEQSIVLNIQLDWEAITVRSTGLLQEGHICIQNVSLMFWTNKVDV